jgi:hypothetical protein
VIVDNFNVTGVLPIPAKAHAVFLVYANAMLAFAVTLEGLKMVSGRNAEFVESLN